MGVTGYQRDLYRDVSRIAQAIESIRDDVKRAVDHITAPAPSATRDERCSQCVALAAARKGA